MQDLAGNRQPAMVSLQNRNARSPAGKDLKTARIIALSGLHWRWLRCKIAISLPDRRSARGLKEPRAAIKRVVTAWIWCAAAISRLVRTMCFDYFGLCAHLVGKTEHKARWVEPRGRTYRHNPLRQLLRQPGSAQQVGIARIGADVVQHGFNFQPDDSLPGFEGFFQEASTNSELVA
jgi:hypothetical protein